MAAKKKRATKGGSAKKQQAGKKQPAKKATKRSAKKAAPKKAAPKKATPKKAAPKKAAPKKAASAKASAKKSAPRTATAPKSATTKAAAKATPKAGGGARPTTTIVQHVFIQATPLQVYDALVDPTLASSIVGGACEGEPAVGATFTHWNKYIHGKHLELVRGERIVQEWRTTEWPTGAAPSRLEISLDGSGGGTELTMTHSQVPTEQAEEYRQGWIDFYWTPMRAHFGE
ncbi:MAG: SRPBCC domain-containing protein [Deltaproteobacteria bacterium]|nr:SRPBCC domain-containing protein [Deltaproteobacteria bacterium]